MIRLPTGVNRRGELKVLEDVRVLWIVEELDQAALWPPDGGACERPVPGVVNRAPRVFRNVSNGVTGAVVSVEPPPSQLISR